MIKKCRRCLALIAFFASPYALSAAQCGPYLFEIDTAGKGSINGENVTSQKATFLGSKGDWDNIKLDMTLMPARDGFMYGYEFIKQNGKAFLNVELIRRRMDAPRIIGSFDCKRVPD